MPFFRSLVDAMRAVQPSGEVRGGRRRHGCGQQPPSLSPAPVHPRTRDASQLTPGGPVTAGTPSPSASPPRPSRSGAPARAGRGRARRPAPGRRRAPVGRDGRPVGRLEEVAEVSAPSAKRSTRSICRSATHVADPVTEELAHVGLVAPQRGRLHAGRRRRDVRLHRGEHPADEPGRRPADAARSCRPGRVTRTSSSALSWWCGANITPTHDITTSKASSAKGSASASPSRHSTVTPARSACSRPDSSSSGVRSLATTVAPRCAAGTAALPEPAATSSTRCPAETATGVHEHRSQRRDHLVGHGRVVAGRPHRPVLRLEVRCAPEPSADWSRPVAVMSFPSSVSTPWSISRTRR